MRRVRPPAPVPDAAAVLAEDVADAGQGERDKALLRELTNGYDLRDDEQDAFDDMLDRLARGRVPELSEKQRAWVEGVADRLGVLDPAERNARVPRGRDVPTPEQLLPDALKKALLARRAARGRVAR
jgi:hypothetical protein